MRPGSECRLDIENTIRVHADAEGRSVAEMVISPDTVDIPGLLIVFNPDDYEAAAKSDAPVVLSADARLDLWSYRSLARLSMVRLGPRASLYNLEIEEEGTGGALTIGEGSVVSDCWLSSLSDTEIGRDSVVWELRVSASSTFSCGPEARVYNLNVVGKATVGARLFAWRSSVRCILSAGDDLSASDTEFRALGSADDVFEEISVGDRVRFGMNEAGSEPCSILWLAERKGLFTVGDDAVIDGKWAIWSTHVRVGNSALMHANVRRLHHKEKFAKVCAGRLIVGARSELVVLDPNENAVRKVWLKHEANVRGTVRIPAESCLVQYYKVIGGDSYLSRGSVPLGEKPVYTQMEET